MVTMWTIWQNVAEAGFTSITASASGCEKSGLSSKVKAKFSGGASIASFGDAWKVGSGLIVIGVLPVLISASLFLLGAVIAEHQPRRCHALEIGRSDLSECSNAVWINERVNHREAAVELLLCLRRAEV